MAMEDDDDEFGDLYTDVLRPIATPTPAPPPALLTLSTTTSPSSPNSGRIPPSSPLPETSLPPIPHSPAQIRDPDPSGGATEEDWILGQAPIPEEQQPSDWNEDEEDAILSRDSKPAVSGLAEELGGSRDVEGERVEEDGGARVEDEEAGKLEVEDEIGGFDQETVIPGLSAGPFVAGGGVFGGDAAAEVDRSGDDWDSDSGDDLQIVLNDDSVDRRGGIGNEGVGGEEDDEDGEDDLVIVADEGQLHHHHQVMEEQDWGEEVQPAMDGEKKEVSEAAKGSVGAGAVAGRNNFGGHGFHPQHHSQFKYIRPGAAPGPGVAAGFAGGTSQIRPFPMGSIAGRGRGLQRGFHPGYGLPTWANSNSARPFSSGLEFTLPSHKTIFDIDIDAFEEKPWKLVGVDISDFFNFELDEENWKEYCKQLEQLRLESTMQSKIRVYESGRSEQDYDPDLPPELAAASGLQDISAENPHAGKVDGGQSDVLGQGRGSAWMRPQLPTGRAIQVETGTVERLPTIDTRHPRYRESDAIIEIVPQGSLDESEQPENGVLGDEHTEGYEGKESSVYDDSKCYDRFPTQNGKRDSVTRELHSAHNGVSEGDGILPFPPEISTSYYPSSKMRSSSSPGGGSGRHAGRQTPETQQERDFDGSDEYTNDVMSNQSTQMERNGKKQKSDVTGKANKSEMLLTAAHAEKETSIENIDSEHDDRLDFADSTEEREEMASDSQHTCGTPDDSSSSYSLKKQKLTSQVEQPADLDSGDGDKLRTIVADNTRAKSGSGNDYVKHGEGCEDEIMQDPRDKSFGDARKHPNSNKHGFQQRDDYGRASRHELDRRCIPYKGKDSLHHSHVHRDLDISSTHYTLEVDGSEKPKERGSSVGLWHKRDGEVHGRKVKDGDLQIHNEEMGSRHRNKLRVSERKGGGEDLHIRKQTEEGYWRSRHDREVGPRKREGGEILMSRRENLDDVHSNRRKDEEHHRKEKVTKEFLHGQRARDDSGQSKKERIDDADPRRKEGLARARDKTMDHHFSGHRDESRRHREREDRQRTKQVREDIRGHREREEGESIARDGHVLEHKLYDESGRAKDGAKGFNSDKDSILRRKRNEQTKRGGLVETHSRHKGHQDIHARESQFSSEMKSYRNGRLSSHSSHSLHSDRQLINREKHRNNMRRSNEPEPKQNSLAPSKRKHEDDSVYQSEKVNKNVPSDESMKRVNGRESTVLKEHYHADQKQETIQEEKTASDDESQQESRRGRSKLERWTSHIERDFSSTSNQSGFSSLRNMEVNDNNIDTTKMVVNKPADLDNKDANVVQISDREESDRHLETVAKLKKRSERFKLPMPVEDTTTIKKVENEIPVIQGETLADSEIKQERPARKRRWGSS